MRAKRNVFVVDSDKAQCNALSTLLASSGCMVRTYPSAEAFLGDTESAPEGIMLLEQRLMGMSGLELQHNLARRGTDLPIIFLSRVKDVRVTVKAMKAGAIDFLAKPFSNDELFASVNEAFTHADANKKNNLWIADLRLCYDRLTDREREIIQHVAGGMSSREVGERLGLSPRTVEVHRRSIMKKMEAKSLVDLARKYAICTDIGSFRLRGGRTIVKH